jgi:hypothetical protein
LQGQADDFMKKEVMDGDDYADWIRWVADEEHSSACITAASHLEHCVGTNTFAGWNGGE